MKSAILAAAAVCALFATGCRWFCDCEPEPAFAGPAPPYYSPPPGAAAGGPAPVFVQPGEPIQGASPPARLVP